ncbi:hypothetical protein BGZ76_005594 [Entomortierella beljakovae]|nr:hypothetical protein BGZ76_005594 [Entomortierella beljakovae]
MSSLSALRRPRPFSFSGHKAASPVFTHVRRASLIPCIIESTSPPPAPLTLEQVEALKLAQRQQNASPPQQQQHQAQVENSQRVRQQQEIQDSLAKDRAVSYQQKSLSRWYYEQKQLLVQNR